MRLTGDGLLRTIRDARPQSVDELARLTNRAEPNLLRTLGKLRLEIDPYATMDRSETSQANG